MLKIIKYSITVIIFSIITSLFVIYFYLLKGISISNINYKFLNIDKLYIKIEKKIIFKAKNIYIHKKNDSNSNQINFKETTNLIKNILKYLSFFQEIKIENLNINKNKIELLSLSNNKLLLNTKDIYLQTSFFPKKNKINYTIYELNIKKYDFILKNITGNFYSDLLHLFVKINTIYNNTKFHLFLNISNKNIKYKGEISNISKKTFSHFKEKLTILKKLNIDKILFQGDDSKLEFYFKNFITQKDNFIIKSNSMKGHFNIKNSTLLLNNSLLSINNPIMNLNIYLNNNRISYTKNLSTIKTEYLIIENNQIKTILNKIILSYFNDIVHFQIDNIKFKNNQINGNIIYSNGFYNLKKESLNLINKQIVVNYRFLKNINIQNLKTNFDVKKDILNTHIDSINSDIFNLNNGKISKIKNNLKINFYTNNLLSKKLITTLKKFGIDISIYQENAKNNIKAEIDYNLKNNKLHTNLDIQVEDSKLMLSENSYLNISHSELNLQDSNIYLKNSDLKFNQSIVNLDYHINKGLINLDDMYISTNGNFRDLNLTDILDIKNYPEDLYIDLNDLNISLKNLKTSILIDDNISVNIEKLSIFYPFIPYLKQYQLKEGKIKVDIGNKIKIISNISETNQTILENNLTPIKKFDINTTIDDNNITIQNNKLNFNIIKNNQFTLIKGFYKDLDLNITQFIDNNNTDSNNENNESSTKIKANIKGENSYIVYNDVKLYSTKLSIDYNSTDTKISSIYKDRNITILDNNGTLKIYGLNIDEKTLKDLTNNSNILQTPLLTIFALKNKNSNVIQGFIDIKKGYIKELKAFTNVLAFINLIPSLVTFQAVGFSSKGYKIKNGYIEYIFYNKILYFKEINIKGENLTFTGQGYIDLNKNSIKLNVNVNLLIKLVKDIPIVNYILLGKDGGITIKLTIDGDLKDPNVHKNTASNIIEAPLGIIKRTLLTPFRPFMKEEQ